MIDAQQVVAWRALIATWPSTLRSVAERFPPWAFVQITDTGAIGRVHGFHETVDGEVTVDVIVRQQWNPQLPFKSKRDEMVTRLALTDLETVQ